MIFPLHAFAQDKDFTSQLINLTHAVREAEKQDKDVKKMLKSLREEEQEILETIKIERFDTAKAYHALQALKQKPYKSAYLLPDVDYKSRFIEVRRAESFRDILLNRINTHTTVILEMQSKQAQIEDYLHRRELLSLTLNASLDQVKSLNEKRVSNHDFQAIINELKRETDSLDLFVQSLLNLPNTEPEEPMGPLVFTLPVSGILTTHDSGINIAAAPQSLVTTPARGMIVYAGEFKPLGKVVVINHGEGYLSILRNFGEIYVKEGFVLEDNEPVGILPNKNRDNFGNNPMLYYELRYNHDIINPIKKITGL